MFSYTNNKLIIELIEEQGKDLIAVDFWRDGVQHGTRTILRQRYIAQNIVVVI